MPAGIAPVRSYIVGKQKEAAQEEYRKQCDVFRKNKVDMVLGEVPICFTLLPGNAFRRVCLFRR